MAARTGKKEAPSTWALIEVLVSFNGMRVGDWAQTEVDDTVKGWTAVGLVRIEHTWPGVDNGADPAGPGEPEPDVQVGREE